MTTALVVGVVLLFLTGPLQYLPTCVLGVLVFLVALRLINFKELHEIRGESPQEYALAVMTAVVVVLVGVEEGIVLAMLVSLARVVRHDYHPHSGVLQLKRGRKLEARARWRRMWSPSLGWCFTGLARSFFMPTPDDFLKRLRKWCSRCRQP